MGLLLLAGLCSSCDTHTDALRSPGLRSCLLSIRVELTGQPAQVGVVGAFNDYDPKLAPLSLLDPERGEWGLDLALSAGDHLYAISADGRVFNDPSARLSDVPTSGPWRGVERSLARIPDCSQGRWYKVAGPPKELSDVTRSVSLAYERATLNREGAELIELSEGAPLDRASVTLKARRSGAPLSEARPLSFEWRDDALEALSFELDSLPEGKHWITLSGRDQRGLPFEELSAPLWVEAQPFKWEGAPMYQVVLDRLNPPLPEPDEPPPTIAERWGGGLGDTLELLRAGYFERFGVGSLWLSPVYRNPSGLWAGVEGGAPRYEGYHGYWPTAPRLVGEEWGGEALLDELVREAHDRGLRVILDVVLNHVHESHPYLELHPEWFSPSGCLCGRGSCDWGRYIETCQFTDYLPDLRWSPEALRAQVDDALWWMERFELDGLRVDAVPMMPRRVTRLLSAEVHKRFEALGERQLLIGETFTGPREWSRIAWYLGPWGLDGQFDFALMWTLREALAWGSSPLSSVAEAWDIAQARWGTSASVMGLFVGNHDVTRFVSEAAGQLPSDPWLSPPPQPEEAEAYERLALAYALSLTLPGLPVLFYGDEVGLAGANDPDNRRPFWPLGEHSDANTEVSALNVAQRSLRLKLSRLAQLRACLPGLQSAALSWRVREPERLIYERGEGLERVIVVAQRAQGPALELEELGLSSPRDGSSLDSAQLMAWRALEGERWSEGSPTEHWPSSALSQALEAERNAAWSVALFTASPALTGCLASWVP